MTSTFRLGRFSGIDIGVNWTVLLIVAIAASSLGWGLLPELVEDQSDAAYAVAGVAGGLLLMASVLVHELSHAIVAQRAAIPVRRITLWMLGGVAELGEQARSPRDEFRIAIAGPAASALLGVVGLGLAAVVPFVGVPDLGVALLVWLGLVNISLAVFNMLPGAPLDGGRVLAALIWWRTGDARVARHRSAVAGGWVGQVMIVGGLLMFLAFARSDGLWLAFIGWFVLSAANAEADREHLAMAFGDLRVGEIMSRAPVTFEGSQTVADFVAGSLMHSPVSTFPLVDDEGRPSGLLTLRQLRSLPRERQGSSLAEVATPITELRVASPEDRVADALDVGAGTGGRLMVVDQDGRLVGVVSPTDIADVFTRLSIVDAVDDPARGRMDHVLGSEGSGTAPRRPTPVPEGR